MSEKIELILKQIDRLEAGPMDVADAETVKILKKIVEELDLDSEAAELAYERRLARMVVLERMERERQEERQRMSLRWCILVHIFRLDPLQAFALCTPAAPAPTF